MLEKYVEEQPIVTKLLINSINTNKLVQAYLFVSEDKSFLMQYCLDFAKSIITDDEKIFSMIDNNMYPELKIIEPVNNIIKKEELNNLQHEFFVKPTLGKKLVYIINGADKLNSSSANTILKFLEEPNDDVVAILLTDNLSKVLPTIKSRCQVISLLNNNDKKEKNSEYYYNIYSVNRDKEEFTFDYYKNLEINSIDFIKKLENNKINSIIHVKELIFDVYITKDDLAILFDLMLYFYYDILNLLLKREIRFFSEYKDELKRIESLNNLSTISSKLKVIEDAKNKLNYNMNLKLLIDNFIIKFSEV